VTLKARNPGSPQAAAYLKITDCVWDTCVYERERERERERESKRLHVCVCLCAYVGLFHSLKLKSGFYKRSLIMEKEMMHYFGELWP